MQRYLKAISTDSLKRKHSDSSILPLLNVILLSTHYTQEQLNSVSTGQLLVLAWLGMSDQVSFSATLVVTISSQKADGEALRSQLATAFNYLNTIEHSQLILLKMAPNDLAAEATVQLSQVTGPANPGSSTSAASEWIL